MMFLINSSPSDTFLTLPKLSLLWSKQKRCKDFWKRFKPCHVGIHWLALAECSQMSTHMSGFQSFSRFFASFRIGQISQQQHKGCDFAFKYFPKNAYKPKFSSPSKLRYAFGHCVFGQ